MIEDAVRDFLNADSNITDDLATFEFTTGSPEPAIFTDREMPETRVYPAIWILVPASDFFGTRADKGAELFVDIQIFDNKTQSKAFISALAYKVWLAIERGNLQPHLQPLGYDEAVVLADAPISATDEDGYPGYIVRARIKVLKR